MMEGEENIEGSEERGERCQCPRCGYLRGYAHAFSDDGDRDAMFGRGHWPAGQSWIFLDGRI